MARTINGRKKLPRQNLAAIAERVIKKKVAKPAVFRPSSRALLEIRKFQRTTHLLCKKKPFIVFFKKVLKQLRDEGETKATRVTAKTIEALQTAAEAFLVDLYKDSVYEMAHAKRVTLYPQDLFMTIFMKDYTDDLLEHWRPLSGN